MIIVYWPDVSGNNDGAYKTRKFEEEIYHLFTLVVGSRWFIYFPTQPLKCCLGDGSRLQAVPPDGGQRVWTSPIPVVTEWKDLVGRRGQRSTGHVKSFSPGYLSRMGYRRYFKLGVGWQTAPIVCGGGQGWCYDDLSQGVSTPLCNPRDSITPVTYCLGGDQRTARRDLTTVALVGHPYMLVFCVNIKRYYACYLYLVAFWFNDCALSYISGQGIYTSIGRWTKYKL